MHITLLFVRIENCLHRQKESLKQLYLVMIVMNREESVRLSISYVIVNY